MSPGVGYVYRHWAAPDPKRTIVHVVSQGWWSDGRHIGMYATEAEARAVAETNHAWRYTGTAYIEDVVLWNSEQ